MAEYFFIDCFGAVLRVQERVKGSERFSEFISEISSEIPLGGIKLEDFLYIIGNVDFSCHV